MPYQIYVASLNDSMGRIANENPIVSSIERNILPLDSTEVPADSPPSAKRDARADPKLAKLAPTQTLNKRAVTVSPPPAFSTFAIDIVGEDLIRQANSPVQLKLISDPCPPPSTIEYTFPPVSVASTDQTYVYVLDSGVNAGHPVRV